MDEHSVNCQTGNGNSIWTEDYVPNSAILVTEAAESFPNGGRKGFLAWLKDRLTITNTESIEHHQGVDAVWRKFSSVFTILNTIIFYEPIFRLFMRRMMQQLLADGVKGTRSYLRTYVQSFW
jgi:adenosine deaminase CECR1